MSYHKIVQHWFDVVEIKEPPKHLYGEQLPEWFEPEDQIHWMIGVREANEMAARCEAETGKPMNQRNYNWWRMNLSAANVTPKYRIERRNRLHHEHGERFPYDE